LPFFSSGATRISTRPAKNPSAPQQDLKTINTTPKNQSCEGHRARSCEQFNRPQIDVKEFVAHKIRNEESGMDAKQEEQSLDQGFEVKNLSGYFTPAAFAGFVPDVTIGKIQVSKEGCDVQKMLKGAIKRAVEVAPRRSFVFHQVEKDGDEEQQLAQREDKVLDVAPLQAVSRIEGQLHIVKQQRRKRQGKINGLKLKPGVAYIDIADEQNVVQERQPHCDEQQAVEPIGPLLTRLF